MTANDLSHSIRPYRDEDEAAVVAVWYASGQAAYTYLPTWQTLTLAEAHRIFRKAIHAQCAIWVGEQAGRIVAFMALNGAYIDRLYVHPAYQRQGWGTRFLTLAKELYPTGLMLATHQANQAARTLYERHGFRPIRFGLSPPPELAPDVEYHWQP